MLSSFLRCRIPDSDLHQDTTAVNTTVFTLQADLVLYPLCFITAKLLDRVTTFSHVHNQQKFHYLPSHVS